MPLAASSWASASISVSDPFLTIRASQGSNVGEVQIPLGDPGITPFNDPNFQGWGWQLDTGPITISGPGGILGLVEAFSFVDAVRTVNEDPFDDIPDGQVRWGVGGLVQVRSGAADTTFEVIFPTLTLGPIADMSMSASAGIVGTDQPQGPVGDPFDGITQTGAFDTGGSFRALYNGGSIFREYMAGSISNGRGQSVNRDGNMVPPGSFESVGTITSISAHFKFTSSAFDTAAASFDVTVLPSPGSMALLGLGGLVTLRRRR